MEDMFISGAATVIAGVAVYFWNTFAQSQKNLTKFQFSKAQQDWLEEQAERGIRYVYEQVFKAEKENAKPADDPDKKLVEKFSNTAKLDMATAFVKDAAISNNLPVPNEKVIHNVIESVLPVVRPELDKLFDAFKN